MTFLPNARYKETHFAASGTFTVPLDCSEVTALIFGAGSGGAGGNGGNGYIVLYYYYTAT